MMKANKLTVENILYFLAFLLALTLRLASLGSLPLSEHEAALALQALHISHGAATAIASPSALVVWMGGLFFFFGSSETLARLIPALVGSFLVLAPTFFKERLGRFAAVVLAFALAIDPGLVAISRQVDGTILAITLTVFCLAFLNQKKYLGAGICLGLALMSGPTLWPGWLGLGLAFAWEYRPWNKEPVTPEWIKLLFAERQAWLKFGLAALVTLFFGGSLFMLVPAGLGAFASAVPDYFQGFIHPTGVSVFLLLIALLVYQLLALFMAPAESWRGWREGDGFSSFLTRWFFIALLIALIYPSRQVTDLAWCVLPLWALAARSIEKLISQNDPQDLWPVLGQAVLTGIILVFGWFALTALTVAIQGNVDQQLRLAALAGAVILLIGSMAMVAWGWSFQIMRKGFSLGLAAFLFIILLSNSIHAGGLAGKPAEELWLTEGSQQSEDLLVKTVNDTSIWKIGRPGGLQVVVMNYPSKALEWALRKCDSVQFMMTLPQQTTPAIVITHGQDNLTANAAYRGQLLGWTETTNWSLLKAEEWLQWLAYRSVPTETDSLYIWVRGDLFPGGSATQSQP
jgi:hypothetical protein